MPGTRNIAFRFDGQVVLVTGAAAGLGRVLAVALRESGAQLLLTDINAEQLAETVGLVAQHGGGGRCEAFTADISSEDEVTRLFDHLDGTFGRIDILLNIAGINPLREPPETFPLDTWNTILRVNLTGTLLCAQAAGRRMLSAGTGGSIVNVSSIAASTSLRRGNVAFGTSKAAVHQLTRELAVAWAPHGIRVNTVQPAQIDSPAWQTWRDDPTRAAWLRAIFAGIPAGRMATAEEVAWPILFLASDAAAMITGSILAVDGGNLALNPGAVELV